jgi:uncharacterized protein YbjT (DUF2867 family)
LTAAGAEAVDGDLKDPASLRAACEGVSTVVTTANAARRGGEDSFETVDRLGNAALIDAAVDAGVERFVFVSALAADTTSPVPLLAAKGATEERLQGSSMIWTVLRPDTFMDVWIPMVVGGPALSGRPVTLSVTARGCTPSWPSTTSRPTRSRRQRTRRPRTRC